MFLTESVVMMPLLAATPAVATSAVATRPTKVISATLVAASPLTLVALLHLVMLCLVMVMVLRLVNWHGDLHFYGVRDVLDHLMNGVKIISFRPVLQ